MVDSDQQALYEFDNPNLVSLRHEVPDKALALAEGQLAFGVNKVFAHFDAFNATDPTWTIMADARTQWIDQVTIDGGDLNGTIGTFTASLRVFGSDAFAFSGAYETPDADLYGFWDSWIGTSTDGGGSYLVGGWFGSWYSDGAGGVEYYGDELNQPLTEVTLEFIYGQPFLLSGNMEAYFHATNDSLLPGTVSGTLDFSHSAYWNGMGDFRDSNGNLVAIEGFSSRSGTDWLNPVPEPATMLALASGLAAMALRRRRVSLT